MTVDQTSRPLTALPLLGSLREGSFNRLLLAAARDLAPPSLTVLAAPDLRPIPPYDDDQRAAAGLPAAVVALRAAIAAADAVLIVSPEYNFSVPGFLKNVIDWASRGDDQPFRDKPVAIMGASGGPVGTARMQYHLRQVLVFLDARPLNKPEVMVGLAASRFDDGGRLVDERSRDLVAQQLVALEAWTRRLRPAL